MATTEHYDLISLGSGEAGKILAWTYAATNPGKRCTVIERSMLGGSCPNVACLPSKNILHSAKVAHLAQNGRAFGLDQADNKVDMSVVKKRKDAMVAGIQDVHLSNFRQSNVEVIWGEGKFVAPKTIEVRSSDGAKKTVSADVVLINTGSRARIPENIPGLVEAKPLTHVEILNLDQVPDHLVILGGGYVGLEFAQAMKRFGARVTVIERNARIVKNEDPDVSDLLREVLEKEGVEFRTSTSVISVSGISGEKVTVQLSKDGDKPELQASHILAATGRIPNTSEIGLDLAGVEVTAKGHVKVDEHLRTTAQNVFAVGDCAGSPYFTHMGFDDFRIVRDVLAGKTLHPDRKSKRQVPFTLFTDPELAHIGLREHEAKAAGIEYRLAKVPMGAFLRTRTMGGEESTVGFAKALVSVHDDTVLGFTAVGPEAGEFLPVVQLVMKRGLPYTDISELIVAHPTMNEGVVALFGEVPAKA